MKNINPYILKCSEAGKLGAAKRWAGHCSARWTSIRVSSLVKLHLQQDAVRLGFRSLNDYLHTLEMWSGEIMSHRAAVLEKRKKKLNSPLRHLP